MQVNVPLIIWFAEKTILCMPVDGDVTDKLLNVFTPSIPCVVDDADVKDTL